MKRSITHYLFLFFVVAGTISAIAQPANDQCTGATSVTPNGTCVAGTTVGANDSWTGTVGCQTGGGNHLDVWYSFVATGSSFAGTVTTAAPFAGDVEFVLASSTTGCTGPFTIVGSNCGTSPITLNATGLTVGNTYYFTISSDAGATPGPFTVCPTTTTPAANCTNNDACANAQVLTLNASGGAAACVTDCNTGAAPGIDFVGNVCEDMTGPTVWYSITTDAGAASLDITLTSANLTDPEFTVWQNTCSPWTGVPNGCVQGTGGSASINDLVVSPNTTYIIAVSDNTGDQGTFNLCVTQNLDNSACNVNDILTEVSSSNASTPVGGPYAPGETVNYCYTINQYMKFNCNWLMGIVPTFGDCWSPSSFNAQGMPITSTPPAIAGNETGSWAWYPAGQVVYNNIVGSLPPNTPLPGGWFFQCNSCGLSSTDPDNSWGDGGAAGAPANDCDINGNGYTWTVCFSLIAGTNTNCSNGTTDCSVQIKTYADGEIGGYTNTGCTADLPFVFPATFSCCVTAAPTASSPVNYCQNATASPLTATGTGLLWYTVASGGVGSSTAPTPSTAVAGTTNYYVSQTLGGCEGPRTTVAVVVNPLPNANAGADQSITCTTTTVTLSGSSTTGGATYSWSPGGTTPTSASTSVSSVGNYTLTVTNPVTGCTSTDLVVVGTNTVAPNANAGSGQTLTCTTTTVTLSGSSTTGGATFSWNPGGTTPTSANTNVSAAGNYTLTVTNPANGCTNTSTVSVSTNTTVPNANAGTAQTITCASPTVTLSGSSTTGGATFSWNPGGTAPTSPSTNVTAAGTYTLTVTNPANGCTNTSTVAVATNTTVPNANAGTDQILTCASPTVTLSGSSTTGGATFSWSPGGTTPTAASTNVSATGNYTLTVTNPANGCTSTDVVVVTPDANIPNASAGSSQTLTCATTTVTLSGSSTTGGVNYSWSPGGTTPTSASTNVSAAGTYTLTVTNPANGCSNSSTVVVSTNTTVPNANAGSNQTLTCTTTTVTLSGSSTTGGATFSWSPGGTSPTSASTNVSATGTYTLTVTNPANGCTNTSTAVVSLNNILPNADAGTNQTISCAISTVTLSGSSTTSGATFAWSPGGTTPTSATTDVSAAGTYTLTVTDPSNGCTNTSTVLVSGNSAVPNITVGSNQTITCATTTVTLTGNSTTSGATFSWSPGGTTPTAATTDVSGAGAYTLTVTDPSNGCTSTGTVTVNTNTVVPDVNAGADQTLTCSVTSVTLSGSSATAGALYGWEGPAAGTPAGTSPTSATTDVSAAGTYTLNVVDPSNGCTASDIVIVSPDANLPNVSAGTSQTITCSTTTVSLGGSSTSNVSFAWSGPGVVSGTTNDTAIVNMDGTYTLTVTDNNNGCTNTGTVQVNIDTTGPSISISAPAMITCISNTVTISSSSPVSGATFVWSGSGLVSGGTSSSPVVDSTGTYIVTVTDPNNGCVSADSTTVTANLAPPDANAGPDLNMTCATTTLSVTGSSSVNGATFNWSGSGIVSGSANDTAVVNATGQYILTVTDPANGCTMTDTVVIIPDANLPNVNAGADQSISCIVTSVTLSGSSTNPNADYSWSGPGGFSSAVSNPNATLAGSYTLTVIDTSNNCAATDIVVVNDSTQSPGANAGADATLTCVVTSASLNGTSATGNVSYAWSGPGGFNSSSQNINVNTTGSYTLLVTNQGTGCVSTDTVDVIGGTGIPNVSAGNPQSLSCSTTSATLSGSSSTSGATFSWSGPNGFSSTNASPSVTDTGTYVLTVTDPVSGCTSSAQVSVSSNTSAPAAAANASSTVITCATTSVALTGSSSTANTSFSWSGPAGALSGNPVSANSAGTYTLTVTDTTNGCTSSQTIVITAQNTPPTATASSGADSLNCANPSISLSSATGSPNATFSWTGPNGFSSTSQNPGTTSTAGTYTVTVTDIATGCTNTATVTLVQGTDPVAGFGANPASGTAPLSVNFTNSSTAGFASYSWTFGDGNTSTSTNPSNIFAGEGTYTVQMVAYGSSAACNDTVFATIYVYPESSILIPNVFSPNGDGINDHFQFLSSGLKELTCKIFDRWGLLMNTVSGINARWDGTTNNGAAASDGTYYYILTATGIDGKEFNLSGYLLLTR
jgi:gliding motility-associated-like protein